MKKLEEVFKKSGIPTYTFVQPLEYNKLLVSLRTPGRGLVVEGPSGIGKTTCVLKILENAALHEHCLILSGRKKDDLELIKALPEMGEIGLIIIDDFHRLDDTIKCKIADFMKNLADRESKNNKVVIVGINKAGISLLHFALDLAGRIDTVQFEVNPPDKIAELIKKGEDALNIKFAISDDIVKEAQGSFHITQMLCHDTCLYSGILEECANNMIIQSSIEFIKQRVFNDLSPAFLDRAKKFATGPRYRPEGRAPYFHLLYFLANSNEWSVQINELLAQNPGHKTSIGQIIDKNYLIDFLNNNPELNDVIHYDSQTKVLSVEDPKFVYFIRNILWSKFAQQVGYPGRTFTHARDVALSFAGSDRSIAEALFERFASREVSVFYDKNEQYRILAENVEDYLGPIYKSEAQYVVVILGPDYPKKIWTKFESEQFKSRFGTNSVIPIWLSTSPPGMFDETSRVGGITIDIALPLPAQLDAIADVICRRIQDGRYPFVSKG